MSKELESAIREYIDVHNEDPTSFVWTGLRIKSWIASLATPSAPWLSDPPDLCHGPLGQQTSQLEQRTETLRMEATAEVILDKVRPLQGGPLQAATVKK